MALMKEYTCLGHGTFESTKPVCPSGCNTVNRIFLTAPGIGSQRTRHIDRTLTEIAKDMGVTNMSNRNGSVANSRPVPMGDKNPSGDKNPLYAGFAPLNAGMLQTLKPSDGGANAKFLDGLRKPSRILPEDMKSKS